MDDCLRNKWVYGLSSFIFIFHDTNGHHNNLLLVDIKAFVASSVHYIVFDFTNPAKFADLKILHQITFLENRRCGWLFLHNYCRLGLQRIRQLGN